MRKKNIMLGVIGFVLAVVTGGQAFAALGPGEISMGVFSIPLPGCAPEVTISEKDTSSGCYTMTIQNKTLQNGVCSSSGITPTTKQVCDGKDGENGAGGAVDVTKVYVPYPASTFGGAEPQNEGYIKVTIPAADDGEDDTILKYPDYCEEFYEDGLTKKKCTAQGDATDWANTSGGSPYQTGDNYIFSIDGVEAGYPRLEYVRPVLSSGTSGYPTEPGYTKNVTRYENGREQSDLVAIDSCDKYAKSTDTSDRVVRCTVGAPAGTPGATSPYTPGVTYCLGNHLSDCNQYTIPVGAVDVCAGLTSSDNAWETTVTATESEYVAHAYSSTCTTNCTGTVGYKSTKEVMCDGNVRTNKVYDTCSSATAPSNVTCATGYAYQQCVPVDSRASVNSYSGCFPDPLNGLYAHKDDIVPVTLAADSDYLYYCNVSNCDTNASCWVDGTIGGTPNYNNGNGCWGRVSVQGLQGENGESCFVTNDGTNWNMCCSPTYAGNDCSIITDDDIINKLNGMMCQVNYTHKYLHDDGNGGFTANTIKDGARGERVIVTNSCNDSTENLDTYYGEDATIEEYDGWPKIIYFAPQKSNGKLVKPGYTRVEHKYLRDGGATTMDSAQTVDSPCITVSKQTRTASGDTVTTQKQTVQKCQIQSYGELSSDSTGTWPTGNWYCLNTDASGSCDGYSDTISDEITSTLKYHLPIMKGISGDDATTPVAPGWTYNEEKDAGNVTVRNTERNKDECNLVYRKLTASTSLPEQTWKCTVGAPGDASSGATYTNGHEYCLGIVNGGCSDYQETIPESNPCAGISGADNLAKAVKKVASRQYTRNTNSQGTLTSVYKMCDDTDHTESTADECKEVPTPSGQTCTNGVWMQCTRQADEGTADATARGTTYGYCATYPQCSGANSSSSSIVKKTQRSYTVPSGSTGTGNKVYYTTPGKVTDVKIACNDSTISTDESAEDQCEEIPDTNSICPTNKVLKTCKRKGDENSTNKKAETTYNLCTNGTSIFGTISDNDPCASVADNATLAAKTVKKTEYEYIAKGATGNNAGVGYVKKTKIMCDDTSSVPHEEDEYIYDTCVPQAQASGCNGASDKNYKCYKQNEAYNSASREYDACNPKDTAVALSSAVANKLDSDVTFTTGTYNNKDYILMSATGITNKPVVPVDELKPQSLFEIWKDDQDDDARCQALFDKNCSGLTASDMLLDLSAQGNWARAEYEKDNSLTHDKLGSEKFQESLKPCKSGISITSAGSDENGGNKYTMTCTE